MRRRMIDKDIARKVEHFDTLILDHMESLTRLVSGESAVFSVWMPVWIDHRTAKEVIFRLQPFPLSVCLEHRCPMITTYMENKL